MVYKFDKDLNINDELNERFVDILERNISDKRQSIIFLGNNTTITVNSRGVRIALEDDALLIYRDDILKDIIDINNVLAIVTK